MGDLDRRIGKLSNRMGRLVWPDREACVRPKESPQWEAGPAEQASFPTRWEAWRGQTGKSAKTMAWDFS